MDHEPFPYRAYTKVNDRVIGSEQILVAVREYPDSRFPEPDFVSFHEAARGAFEEHAYRLAKTIREFKSGVAVTLLLDHSGSLRGERACLLATTAGAISLCLTEANVRHELLGFTTRSWHGGISRASWLKAGDPFPGRLCDLLHIVHRPFQATSPLTFDEMRRMTLPSLWKENIDGEAIEWAAERLRATEATRRILMVISDGVPVDDATLLANDDAILTKHLEDVTAAIVRKGDIELYALSVEPEHWLPHYYPQYAVAADVDELAQIALPMMASIVASSESAPTADQLAQRRRFSPGEEAQVLELP